MMPIIASCPHPECGETYSVDLAQIGQTEVCRRCRRTFVVKPGNETKMAGTDSATKPESPRPDVSPSRDQIPLRLGRFEIRGRLGEGALGTVYRAHDPVLDREVALKIPRAAALEHPEAKARFLREPKAAARLFHPGIVPVFDAGSDGNQLYITSAYIEGRTLKAVLEDDPPKLRRTAQIVRELAEALDYAHRMGVIHRDVKPANVTLDAQGQPMLMDFGLARLTASSEEKLTQDGTVMGTPAYMAPEQADGSLGEVGPASDQYSLGVVLYEMLCGETPFTGPAAVLIFNAIHQPPESPRRKKATIPRDMETICLKAMSKRASDRYATCGEMAEDLRRWLADEPIQTRRMGFGERFGKWTRRKPVLTAVAMGVASLGVVSTVLTAGLLVSRHQIALALQYEEEQTSLAESEAARADKQTRLAQEQQRRASDAEKSARDKELAAKIAVAKLKAETKARIETEAAAKAEEDRRGRMAEEVKQKESKISETNAAITVAEGQLKRVANVQKAPSSDGDWETYIERLSAADRAYQEKDMAAALELLERCAADQRGWEWNYLKMLCDGEPPVETDIPGVAWDGLVVSGNLRFACNRAAGGDIFRVVKLPDLNLVATVRLTGTAATGKWYLSPTGDALLAESTPVDWLLVTLTDGNRTLLRDKVPVGPFPFSRDGTLVQFREEARKLTRYGTSHGTGREFVIRVATAGTAAEGEVTPKAIPIDSSTRDSFQSATSSDVFGPSVVGRSPDDRRELRVDLAKGRFVLFESESKHQLPRLKFLPWEKYGAIELQLNAEWTRIIMARQAVFALRYWSMAHHVGEK